MAYPYLGQLRGNRALWRPRLLVGRLYPLALTYFPLHQCGTRHQLPAFAASDDFHLPYSRAHPRLA